MKILNVPGFVALLEQRCELAVVVGKSTPSTETLSVTFTADRVMLELRVNRIGDLVAADLIHATYRAQFSAKGHLSKLTQMTESLFAEADRLKPH
jgi:hypothetical protein